MPWAPAGASRTLYVAGLLLLALPALMLFAVIPFGGVYSTPSGDLSLVVANPDWGLLFVLMLGTLSGWSGVVTAWASNAPSRLPGSLRALAQTLSAQLPLGLCGVGVCMVYGTLQLQDLVRAQDTSLLWLGVLPLPAWGIFLQPLGFVLFVLCALLQARRPPFDAALTEPGASAPASVEERHEGLPKIVDLLQGVAIAALVTTLFLGGWSLPWLSSDTLLGFLAPALGEATATLLCVFLQVMVFVLKLLLVIALQVGIGLRIRRRSYVQGMNLCWKVLLPLAFLNVLATAGGLLTFGGDV